MGIRITNLSKNFDSYEALKDINLDFREGELTALLGPSGSGKTTLLRIIAGLESADEGRVEFFGQDVANKGVGERGIGFVFQHYALFKHMNVFENIAFGLKVRPKKMRPSKEEIRAKVTELLKMVQLENFASRYPHELSGGQKQRVALARALAVEPKVLLLDEPFGALDAKVRAELRKWLRRLHDEIKLTSIFVTHDQEEALEVSDEIVVMNKGRIEQIGSPAQVYEHPANPFVYSFLGNVNLFRGRVENSSIIVDADAGELLFVRPHEIELELAPNLNLNSKKGEILRSRVLGHHIRLDVRLLESSEIVEVDIPNAKYREILEAKPDFVWLNFTMVRAYKESSGEWSDYVI